AFLTGFPLEWKCDGSELIGGSGGRGRHWRDRGFYLSPEPACDFRSQVRLAESSAVLLYLRSVDLAVHAGHGVVGSTWWISRPQRTPVALVFTSVVVADYVDDLCAGEDNWLGED